MCGIFALVSFSTAWIRRDWNPQVYQENIEVQTGGSLAIKLDDGQNYNNVTLNEILGVTSFRLKQVSNYSGESNDFFALSVEDNATQAKLEKLSLTSPSGEIKYKSYSEMGIANGYIEVSFLLIGQSQASDFYQYVYLSKESGLSIPEAIAKDLETDSDLYRSYQRLLQSIRISITIHGISATNPVTYGLTYIQTNHTAITDKFGHDPDGKYLYGFYNSDGSYTISPDQTVNPDWYETNSAFQPFSYYQAAFNDAEGKLADKDRCFFMMQPTESRRITIRVWLEGNADGCTDDISGLLFNLSLRFDSVNVPSSDVNQPSTGGGSESGGETPTE